MPSFSYLVDLVKMRPHRRAWGGSLRYYLLKNIVPSSSFLVNTRPRWRGGARLRRMITQSAGNAVKSGRLAHECRHNQFKTPENSEKNSYLLTRNCCVSPFLQYLNYWCRGMDPYGSMRWKKILNKKSKYSILQLYHRSLVSAFPLFRRYLRTSNSCVAGFLPNHKN